MAGGSERGLQSSEAIDEKRGRCPRRNETSEAKTPLLSGGTWRREMTTQTSKAPAKSAAMALLTPTKIKILGAAMALSLAVSGWAGYNALAAQSTQQTTLQTKTAPAIEGVAQARASLSDANSNMMESFIGGKREASASWIIYELDMSQARRAIEGAAETVSSGDQERQPLLEMMSALSDYERLVGQALARQGDDSRTYIEAADSLMRTRALPAADALTHSTTQNMASDDERQSKAAQRWAAISAVFAVLFLGIAVAGQVWLARKTRRALNAGVALGTFVAAAALVLGSMSFTHAQNASRVAREGAFESINAVWRARAAVYDANADEALWMFAKGDDAKQAIRLSDFAQQIQTLIGSFDAEGAAKKARAGEPFAGYLGQLAQSAKAKDNGHDKTFDGESDKVASSLDGLATYLFTEKRLHELAQTDFAAAMDWRSGVNAGWSTWAFSYLDGNLQNVMNVNQAAFDQKSAEASEALAGYEWKLGGSLVLILVLCGLGLAARLREYRF